MSRSNPTDGAKNPSTRWFEWAGGDDGGYIRWYDKEAKQYVKVDVGFTFLLLDELSMVKGWHDASDSGIYSNAVRDLRQEVLVVKAFKGGEIASGLYGQIKDRIVAHGGHYAASIYLAYRDGDTLKIGNLSLKGAASGAWMDFKKTCPSKKDATGKALKAYFIDAIKIAGFDQQKKGATSFRVPKFMLTTVSEATNKAAMELDAELQSFLAEYLKRPKADAAKPVEEPEFAPEEREPATTGTGGKFADFEDDIPF